MISSPSILAMVSLMILFCALALLVGYGRRKYRARAAGLSATAAAERDRAARAATQTGFLGSALAALEVELALDYAVKAACALAGAPYGHVASLEGDLHRTVMRGEFEACPSWWHPSVQRLVLRSCREGDAVRSEDSVHGLTGFLGVPVGASGQGSGEKYWGGIVVGGGRGGAEVERDLMRLAADVWPALDRRPDAAGGLDPPSGLPNAASLARALRKEISAGARPALLAVGLGVGAPSSLEDVVHRLGARLTSGGRRAFRYGRDTLVVVMKSKSEDQTAKRARALVRVVDEQFGGSVGTAVGAAVGFVPPGTRAGSPDELVAMALLALVDARGKAERIAGAVVGGSETPGAALAHAGTPLVQGFVKAMVARDPYLAGHSAGVSRVAGHIGRALSLDKEQLDALEVGSLLHDVGKIGMPDGILYKPESLTEEEYAIIKRHPKIGAEIAATIPELSAALPAIRHHHERFDGRGYPDGLRAGKIPLCARVVAVADAFDSMTRERPYGRPMSPDASLQEIMRQAGAQFDPEVTEALSRAVENFGDRRADDRAM